MNVRILALLGSPRRGNSAALLEAFCDGAAGAGLEATRLCAYDLDVNPCLACGGCEDSGRCRAEDGMATVFRAFFDHPLVVIAAPVYFGSLPGHLKNLIDRFQCAWVAKYRLHRPWFEEGNGRRGYLLSVSALDRRAFYEHSSAPVKALFRTLNYSDAGGIYFPGYDGAGDAGADRDALGRARQAGERFARETRRGG